MNKQIVAVLAIAALAGVFWFGSGSHGVISDATAVEEGTKPQVKSSGPALDRAALIAALEERLPGIEISDIEASPVAGFYQVFFSGQLLYVSEDARYVFTGNLLELAENAPINHSEQAMARQDAKLAPERAAVIAGISEDDMVVFKALQERHVITVFTDVDCAYCRKLHREMPELNAQGVTVRYLAFPRAGVGSDAYDKLVSVWCSEDRVSAMNKAKLSRQFSDNTCNNPIAEQYQLTRQFNLSGTPALILEDGELIGGYVPSDDLVAHLDRKTAQTAPASSK